MNEFLKMDIFFVVATLAVILLTIALAMVLLSVYRILKKVEEISAMVSEEGRELRADIAHARAKLARDGLIAGAIGSIAEAFHRPKKRKPKAPSSEPHT